MIQEKTDLGFVTDAFNLFSEHWKEKLASSSFKLPTIQDNPTIVLFISIGNPDIRACVYHVVTTDLSKAMDQLFEKTVHAVRKKHLKPEWIKFDLVTEIQTLPFIELTRKIAKTRKNYFRYGISFDEGFSLAFLEQEINGNAMIRNIKGTLQLDEHNINHYLKNNHSNVFAFIKMRYAKKNVCIFKTESAFLNRKEDKIIELNNGPLTNGVRKTNDLEKEIKSLVLASTDFLKKQVHENGRFVYGYFPAYAKKIGTYNILRHSSSLYAMAEGYELFRDETVLAAIRKGIDYAIEQAMVYKNSNVAFMVDHANENEIKLGANATAILAMTKYMEVTNSRKYLAEAQALARGILQMKMENSQFIHVLSYPDFNTKDLHRIIYYEGEAVFSLLRLYAIDGDKKWLDEAKDSLDYFIANDYWKHHDHWLSYASNEITDYLPEDQYFIFGLKNCHGKLDYIYHRDTTFPTFLELTMAAYKLVQKVKRLGKGELLVYINEQFLNETIDCRAEYQRVGYFYPEVAMYMKYPKLVLNGFFVRHHAFRVRIDDIEHYLSSYCQYLQHRTGAMMKGVI